MPLTPAQIRELHERGAVVLNHEGQVISMGRLIVPQLGQGDTSLRVELNFETEEMRGTFRIPVTRLDELAASWDGAVYRYRLPPGNQRWIRPTAIMETLLPTEPIIETFEVKEPPRSDARAERDTPTR